MMSGISMEVDDEGFGDTTNGFLDESSRRSLESEAVKEGFCAAVPVQFEPMEEAKLVHSKLEEPEATTDVSFHVESPVQLGCYNSLHRLQMEYSNSSPELDESFEDVMQDVQKMENNTTFRTPMPDQFESYSACSDTSLQMNESEDMNQEKQEVREDTKLFEGTFESNSECSNVSVQEEDEAQMVYSQSKEPDMEDAPFPGATSDRFQSISESSSDTSLRADNVKNPFIGWSSSESNDMWFNNLDWKNAKLYQIYKSITRDYYKAVFKPKSGLIRIKTKGPRAYLIHPATYERLTKVSRHANSKQPSEENENSNKELDKEPNLEDKMTDSVHQQNVRIQTNEKQSPKTSLSGGRSIQSPKRYLDGAEDKSLKPVKRQNASKDRRVYQIGMLHPKFPKYKESYWSLNGKNASSTHLKKDNALFPQERAGGSQLERDCPLNGLFAISRMRHSGELEQAIIEHQIEQARQLRQQQFNEALEQQRLAEEDERAHLESERLKQEQETIELWKLQKTLELQKLFLEQELEDGLGPASLNGNEHTPHVENADLQKSISKFFEAQRAGKTTKCTSCVHCGAPNNSLIALNQANEYYCPDCTNLSYTNSPSRKPTILMSSESKCKKYMSPLQPVKTKSSSNMPPLKNPKKVQTKLEYPTQIKRALPLPKIPKLTRKAFQKHLMLSPILSQPKQLHQVIIQTQHNQPQSSTFNQTLLPSNMASNSKQLDQQQEPTLQSSFLVPQQTMSPLPPLQVIPQHSQIISDGREKFIVLKETLTEQQCVESLLRRDDITVWTV